MFKSLTAFAASLFLFLGMLCALNTAQPAQAQLGMTLPTLTEADFQNFLDIYPKMKTDSAGYLQALTSLGVSPEHFQGVITKIVSNLQAELAPGALDALKAQFGDSIALNPAEKALFDKFKDQLKAVL